MAVPTATLASGGRAWQRTCWVQAQVLVPSGVARRHTVLERYSNIRMLAEQTALEEIDRGCAAQDTTRTKPNVPEAQTQRHAASAANVAPTLPIL